MTGTRLGMPAETPHQQTQGLSQNFCHDGEKEKGIEVFPGWRNGEMTKISQGWRKEFSDVKHLQVSPIHEEQVSEHEIL